jgi:hypothetical protein
MFAMYACTGSIIVSVPNQLLCTSCDLCLPVAACCSGCACIPPCSVLQCPSQSLSQAHQVNWDSHRVHQHTYTHSCVWGSLACKQQLPSSSLVLSVCNTPQPCRPGTLALSGQYVTWCIWFAAC